MGQHWPGWVQLCDAFPRVVVGITAMEDALSARSSAGCREGIVVMFEAVPLAFPFQSTALSAAAYGASLSIANLKDSFYRLVEQKTRGNLLIF
jgi:hypothetical protein